MSSGSRRVQTSPDGLPILQPATESDWERWLQDHPTEPGVWLTLGKQGCAVAAINYAQALDVALCFGWIDGQVRGFDEQFTLRRFTPRRARSKWSQVNRDHVERLTEAGRMQPSGLAQVNAAKRDGRWEAAYAPASTITVPDDLQAALDAHPRANEFFAGLTGSDRYAFLYRLHHVTDPARREQRIGHYIARLSDHQTL